MNASEKDNHLRNTIGSLLKHLEQYKGIKVGPKKTLEKCLKAWDANFFRDQVVIAILSFESSPNFF